MGWSDDWDRRRIEDVYDSDAGLVESISACARTEAATAGRRLAAIAELATRRCGTELARSRERWACDAWDSCAAEVAAELTISHRGASTLMHQGLDLRDRFPAVGALLAQGAIGVPVAATVTWRGQLIEDPDLLARVDAEIAEAATRFGTLSEQKLTEAIDTRIERHDPDAVRRFQSAAKGLDVRFGKPDDETGTCSIYGRVKITDADLMDRRAEALARSVCGDDPRTHGERRTEAFGIIAVNGDRLPCRCGKPDCPAAGKDPRAEHLVIHVITNDPGEDHGATQRRWSRPEAGDGPDAGRWSRRRCWARGCWATGQWRGRRACAHAGAVPVHDGDRRRRGDPRTATGRTTGHGRDDPTGTEPHRSHRMAGYRPSTAQQRFVRTRDTTCCFPGCNRPAQYCDVDHTIPYGANGLTHPGNLKCLCRKHHLLKTFWIGRGGWSDEQLPDGTIVWTTPAGLTKTRTAGQPGAVPRLEHHHPDTDHPSMPGPPTPGRELTMPLRTRSRAQQHRRNIKAERARNHQHDLANPPPF